MSRGLLEVMPENLLADKTIYNIVATLDKILKEIDNETGTPSLIKNIDVLPSAVIDLMAWQWHVDFYDNGLTIEQKRELIKTSIAWHRIKGTPAAVEMLTKAIFKKSSVKEWYDYNGQPYHFRMVQDISNGEEDVTPETLARLKKAINTGKNVRSWLETLEFHVNTEENVEYSEEITKLASIFSFEEWMPYGTKRLVPDYDGSIYYGGIAHYDGTYYHNGILLYNGIAPGDWPYYHSGSDLNMDDFTGTAKLAFYDDVSETANVAIASQTTIEDTANSEDKNGALTALQSVYHRCDYHYDGTVEYGGCSYDDDISGSMSVLTMDMSGKYLYDGSGVITDTGRLIAI